MNQPDALSHLYRTEYSKIVSVLTRSCGIDHIELAEDITSDTFLSALENWSFNGTPKNPSAWLYTVAKNKLKNHYIRDFNFNNKIIKNIQISNPGIEPVLDFSQNNIVDSQLQMLFAICHPSISPESQICLALRILCGLGINEIADALLSNAETIHKRLQRAKEKLCSKAVKLEMPSDNDVKERLNTVIQTIYLLFSEGYYSESNNSILRTELCVEAINLAYLLLSYPPSNGHPSNALMSLLCFQASRLEARHSTEGDIILYDEQNRKLWDKELIEKGFYYLQQASKWEINSTYYIEASIAYWHTVDNSHPDKSTSILHLYDILLLAENSPIVAMNRIWAFSKVYGNIAAIDEIAKFDIKKNHFYFVLMAELYRKIDSEISLSHLIQAQNLCKTDSEKKMIKKHIEEIETNSDIQRHF